MAVVPLFGRYEIIRRLAVGGMGELFLARQSGEEHLTILKTLLPDLAEHDQFLTQFLDEATLAATLNHPNIVGIREVGEFEGIHFIAMEYVHGVDADRLNALARRRAMRLPPRAVATMIRGAALGLDHAHHAQDPLGRALRLVHRDVSPQNLMVRDDGVVKVVDFGVASAERRLTRPDANLIKGKPRYMSPEQLRGHPLDGRSDQFSLGVVAWELLTGEALFHADGAALDITAHLAPITRHAPDCPSALCDVVMQMLAPLPAGRFARCREVADELHAFLAEDGAELELKALLHDLAGDILSRRVANLTPDGLPPTERRGAGHHCPSCAVLQKPRTLFCVECGARMRRLPQRPTHDEVTRPERVPGPADKLITTSLRVPHPNADPPPPTRVVAEEPTILLVQGTLLDPGPARAVPSLPVRGRDDVVLALRAALETTMGGITSVVVLEGEGGSGRTCLLDQAARMAAGHNMRVVHAMGARYGAPVALDVIRQVVLGVAAPFMDTPAEPDVLQTMRCLDVVPTFLNAGAEPAVVEAVRAMLDGSGTSPHPAPHERAAALGALLHTMSQHVPLCILVDDVDQGDPASRQMLRDLVTALSGARVAILCTALCGTQDVEAWPVRHLPLGPLTDAAVEQMAADMLGVRGVPLMAQQLLRRRGQGSPLLVREQVRALMEERLLTLVDGAWVCSARIPQGVVPGTVALVAARRLHRLEPAARALVYAAATAGHLMQMDVVGACLPAGTDIHPLLRACQQEGLIRKVANAQGLWRFSQDSVRRALLDGMTPEDAALAARSVADACARRVVGCRGDMVELAAHLYARGGVPQKAVHYASLAVDRMLQQGVGESVTPLLCGALDAGVARVAQDPEGNLALAVRMLKAAVRCAELLCAAHHPLALSIIPTTLAGLPDHLALRERTDAVCTQARLLCSAGEHERARTTMDGFVVTLPLTTDPALFSDLLAELASVEESQGDTAEALTQLARAFHLQSGDSPVCQEKCRARLVQFSRLHAAQGGQEQAARVLHLVEQLGTLNADVLMARLHTFGLMGPFHR